MSPDSTKSTRYIIWGAKGHALALSELLIRTGRSIEALFDNDMEATSPLAGVPLYRGEAAFRHWLSLQALNHDLRALVAIGGERGRVRLRIQRWLQAQGVLPSDSVVHPTAFVALDARLGAGTQILPMSAVCARATLGEGCIVNTRASVDHEGVLGDGVHLAPGATLAGCVTVGDCAMIGAGATVLPRIRIGRDTVVGAGAVVTRDLPDGVVAYGNPARVIRDNPAAEFHGETSAA